MLAARLHGIADLRVTEEQVPVPGEGLSLVRVTAVGICGSDLHWWAQAGIGDAVLARPLVPGHEAAGIIAAGPRQGERVAIDPAITCGRCPSCLRGYRNLCANVVFLGHGSQDGAMREYLAWPTHLLHRLPDALTDVDGALLEPLGVAIHAADLGHLKLAGSAAVAGCGPIGLLLIQVLRAAGAGRVVAFDPLAHRRAAALRLGADAALEPAAGRLLESGEVDVAFEMAGTDEAVGLAMSVARPGGRVVLGGIPDDDAIAFRASVARRKGLTIALVRRMNDTYDRAIALAVTGKADLSIVSNRLELRRADDAFSLAASRRGLKTVVLGSAR
jgi:L-iditol 2-dehydrogenase